eukprot:scaffold13976_cov108-Isochrysis_galbana.AAC.1
MRALAASLAAPSLHLSNPPGDGPLNEGCGAEHCQKAQLPPRGEPGSLLSCSLDGDADRVVFHQRLSAGHSLGLGQDLGRDFGPNLGQGLSQGLGRWALMDGDKIAALAAGFVQEQLAVVGEALSFAAVQTAYANGAATAHLRAQGVPVAIVRDTRGGTSASTPHPLPLPGQDWLQTHATPSQYNVTPNPSPPCQAKTGFKHMQPPLSQDWLQTHATPSQYNVTPNPSPPCQAKTGVKHLHHAALAFDVSVYFEANGHGTALFSPAAVTALLAASRGPPPKCDAARRLLCLRSLVNQAVGDALSDILLVRALLARRGWGGAAWDAMYTDLPSRQTKLPVADRGAVHTSEDESTALAPADLQPGLDALAAAAPRGRCFVRPSGTEDVVRKGAEPPAPKLWLCSNVLSSPNRCPPPLPTPHSEIRPITRPRCVCTRKRPHRRQPTTWPCRRPS